MYNFDKDLKIEELERQLKVLKNENEILKEELNELKDGIIGIYNNMAALSKIHDIELEDIEEI